MTSSAHRLDDTSKIRTVDVTESTEKRSFSDLHLGPNLTQGMNQVLIFSCIFIFILIISKTTLSRLEKDFNRSQPVTKISSLKIIIFDNILSYLISYWMFQHTYIFRINIIEYLNSFRDITNIELTFQLISKLRFS